MNKIESTLLNAISKYPNMPLVIAYSGGVDSQVLLHAFTQLQHANKLSVPLTVCHVNHGLSDNAQAWQNFAEQECQHRNIPIKICQVNVKAKAQQSLEALARDARYSALHSIFDKPSIILTGHHSDDQAETFLLALKRGSGLKGLSAMAFETSKDKDLLVRPFLTITRAEILEYAQQHNLSWIEDESNLDTRFDRNFIRNDIMPLLSQRWPSIVQTINRSSEHCTEGQQLLDELATEDLKRCQFKPKCLSVEPLTKLSTARMNNLIRYFLSQHQYLMASTEQLKQFRQQITANSDKNPAVKLGEHYIRRYKEHVYLTDDFEDVSKWQRDIDNINAQVDICLPDNLGKLSLIADDTLTLDTFANENSTKVFVKPPKKSQRLTIRFRHNNPSCLPDYRNHTRPLKKVLQELNIPPWQRKRIPFLYYDDELVAAIGYFVCQMFVAKVDEPSLNITWLDNN